MQSNPQNYQQLVLLGAAMVQECRKIIAFNAIGHKKNGTGYFLPCQQVVCRLQSGCRVFPATGIRSVESEKRNSSIMAGSSVSGRTIWTLPE